jgi:NitT/TauT family transport system ATP-binding protein
MVRLERVSRRFGDVTALDQINLAVGQREFVALLGPSGCGKSTLLRLLAGLDAPDLGQVSWAAGQAPAAGEIGYVFQDATLLPWASAAENVYLPLRLRGIDRQQSAPDVKRALARLGLQGFENAKPRALSGGMRMRVSIARALVSRPQLLLMDEPFAALDEFTRHRLQEDLRGLWREGASTIVFVTHSIYEAAFLASRILVMTPRPGRLAGEIKGDNSLSRTDPAYASLVAEITDMLHAVMPL